MQRSDWKEEHITGGQKPSQPTSQTFYCQVPLTVTHARCLYIKNIINGAFENKTLDSKFDLFYPRKKVWSFWTKHVFKRLRINNNNNKAPKAQTNLKNKIKKIKKKERERKERKKGTTSVRKHDLNTQEVKKNCDFNRTTQHNTKHVQTFGVNPFLPSNRLTGKRWQMKNEYRLLILEV